MTELNSSNLLNKSEHTLAKILSALLYGFTSIFVTVSNKIVLTTYLFPSFQILAVGQLLFSLFGLSLANCLNFIKLPSLSRGIISKIMPLPLLYLGNLFFGLGSIKSLNLPMFVVLRRFSILFTMYGEWYVFGDKKPKMIQLSVYFMIIGAFIAALYDLKFDFYGYVYIMLNNILTSANGICSKQKLINSSLDEYSLLYFNGLITAIPMLLISYFTLDLQLLIDFKYWSNYNFWFFFLLSTFIGFLLNYSTLLCTKYNSPLSTAVFGCLKNIFVIYVGMFIGGDYVYNSLNFFGLTISALASILYSYLIFKQPKGGVKVVNSVKSVDTNGQVELTLNEKDKSIEV